MQWYWYWNNPSLRPYQTLPCWRDFDVCPSWFIDWDGNHLNYLAGVGPVLVVVGPVLLLLVALPVPHIPLDLNSTQSVCLPRFQLYTTWKAKFVAQKSQQAALRSCGDAQQLIPVVGHTSPEAVFRTKTTKKLSIVNTQQTLSYLSRWPH